MKDYVYIFLLFIVHVVVGIMLIVVSNEDVVKLGGFFVIGLGFQGLYGLLRGVGNED